MPSTSLESPPAVEVSHGPGFPEGGTAGPFDPRAPHGAPAERRSEGFTLVEIAMAISVLGIVAIALVGVTATNARATSLNSQQAEAREATRAQLDAILAWPTYNEIKTQFDGVTFDVPGLTSPSGGSAGRVTIDDTDPNLLRITVRVDWVGPNGPEKCEIQTRRASRVP